jgi:predicted acylesterase/phospholipase RssA
MTTKIQYLSFEGGGVKGLAYSGVLQYFEEQNISLHDLKAVSGSSIGSIVALCVALKYTSTEINTLFNKYNLYNFLSIKKILTCLPNFFYNYGLLHTDELNKIVSEILNIKGVADDITFLELFQICNVNLIVTKANMNESTTIFCDSTKTPNLSVRSTVVTSASFPLIFTPTIEKSLDGTNIYYADGGTFANAPFNYFDIMYDKKETSETAFGFVFKNDPIKINNLLDYIESIVNGLINNSTDMYYEIDGKIDSRIVVITLPKDISTFSVLTDEQKSMLIKSGYMSTLYYFKNILLDA